MPRDFPWGFFPIASDSGCVSESLPPKRGGQILGQKKRREFIRCPPGILPRDVGPRGLRNPWGSWEKLHIYVFSAHLKTSTFRPQDLHIVPFPPPFSSSTHVFLTAAPLKCRPRLMKLPIFTALQGWGTMDRFGTIAHLHAPLCPPSARTSRLRVYNVRICGGCWPWMYSTFS